MSQPELLTHVAGVLRSLGVEFMLTGSHASSLQGVARATHDIDLVVNVRSEHVEPLIQAFPTDRFYLSESAVREAIRLQRMFNLLEARTGEKVDFWVLTDAPFDQSRFTRRRPIDLGGQMLDVSTPEDTILMKLLWAKQCGGSEKQFHDVLQVYELQAERLDATYLRAWVKTLGVDELWQRVLNEAEPFLPPDVPR